MSPARILTKALTAGTLAFLITIALAADDQPVPPSFVEVGDCWSYHARNTYNRDGPIDDYELCVTFVDYQKRVTLAVATVKKDGREIDLAYTTEWNGVTLLAVGTIVTPSTGNFKFPLRVGDAYSSEFTFIRAIQGVNSGKGKVNMKAVGWEDVTVPAGTFHALRIEGVVYVERTDINYSTTQTVIYWYVPAVNRSVKSEFRDKDILRGEELTAFHLNK